MHSRTLLAAMAASLLSSCGIPNPPASVVAAVDDGCVLPEREQPATAQPVVYFASSSLPDCRGQNLRFTPFRGGGQMFGQSELIDFQAGKARNHRSWWLDDELWLQSLATDIERAGSLVVFIHGYNNSYEQALGRAELVRRLHPTDRPVVAISWPSRQRAQSYIYDEASIAWAQDYTNDTLAQLAEMADDITLVAHSMGSRAVIAAVEHLNLSNADRARSIRRIALIAPDADRHRVLRKAGAVEQLLLHDRNVIVYTSQRDWPIRASRFLHGYSRLGSSDCRYSVEYARRGAGRYGRCHRFAAEDRDRLRIVETSSAPGARLSLRHADAFDSCVGRDDLRAFFAGEPDPNWRKPEADPIGDGLRGWYLDPAAHPGEDSAC